MKSNRALALVVLVGVAFTARPSTAQTVDKKVLTLDGARSVVAAAIPEAKRANGGKPATGAIAVVDDGGNVICVERLDNTFAAAPNISIGKARTAALFKKPTKFFEDVIAKARISMVALADFTPLQGGEPIVLDGQVVGAVGVSGAASAARDEQIAAAGAAAVSSGDVAVAAASRSTAAGAVAVSSFDHTSVAAPFDHGAVLLHAPGSHFAIHASRRDKPGQAEVHAKETDVIYVLRGSATFVTGGSVIDPSSMTTRGGTYRSPACSSSTMAF